MKTDSTRKEECEICGKAGSRFVMLGQKGSNNADFYWICEHCEKAIRRLFAQIDESENIGRETMSEKKCRMCCSDAKWELDGDCYCEFCARLQLDVHGICAPQACAMCNNPLGRVYYTDSRDNAFCSAKCALEFNDAKKLGEENDNESGN